MPACQHGARLLRRIKREARVPSTQSLDASFLGSEELIAFTTLQEIIILIVEKGITPTYHAVEI